MTKIRVQAIIMGASEAPARMAAGIASDADNFKPTLIETDSIRARASKTGEGLANAMLLMPATAVELGADSDVCKGLSDSRMECEVLLLVRESLRELEGMTAAAKRPTVALDELALASKREVPPVALAVVAPPVQAVRPKATAVNADSFRQRVGASGI